MTHLQAFAPLGAHPPGFKPYTTPPLPHDRQHYLQETCNLTALHLYRGARARGRLRAAATGPKLPGNTTRCTKEGMPSCMCMYLYEAGGCLCTYYKKWRTDTKYIQSVVVYVVYKNDANSDAHAVRSSALARSILEARYTWNSRSARRNRQAQ